MSKYAALLAEPTPVTEALQPDQVKNNAGGFVFALDDWKRLDRFLILGSDSNTYYQSARQLTRENAACVQRCYDADASRTVLTIVEVSQKGRAPKNDAAIFALALGACQTDVNTRRRALGALPMVCRTSTHLFQFLSVCKALGKGWGRALKNAVASWYDVRSTDAVAFQAIKYRSREGFTHKRTLQLARWRKKDTEEREALYKWMKGEPCMLEALPEQVRAHLEAMALPNEPKAVAALVKKHRLPWEALPTEVTKDPDVWRALLPEMGITALIRNLGSMTTYGVLKPLSSEVSMVVDQLRDVDTLAKGRVHPFNVLLALATYTKGQSRSGLGWQPVPAIVSALEAAFYSSFQTIKPSGKRTLIGLDVSGSMTSPLMGSPLMVSEAAAAMAMTIMRTESNWHIHGFSGNFVELPLNPSMSLKEVLAVTQGRTFGTTDCALPVVYALSNKLEVDVFQVFTDNETWVGGHPVEALRKYRKATGIPAKLVVVGMTSTGFSIADPNDAGMLDVVGFDSAAPQVMAEFARS